MPDAVSVMTNKTPQEAVRGFGQAPTNYAIETGMDKVARFLGIDQVELGQFEDFAGIESERVRLQPVDDFLPLSPAQPVNQRPWALHVLLPHTRPRRPHPTRRSSELVTRRS